MDKKLAKEVVEVLLSSEIFFNKLTFLSDNMSEEEGRIFRRNLGKAMGIIDMDILMPIIKQHPDLDPDKEYFEEKRKQQSLMEDNKEADSNK